MKSIPATIAVALALAALPSASTAQPAQPAPRAAIGIAFMGGESGRIRESVKVAAVVPGGSGDLMGIRAGDVITHAGGKRIKSTEKLNAFIRNLKVGDAVQLTVKRRGESLDLTGTAMARQR